MTTTRALETSNGITTSWIPFTTPGPSISPGCSFAMYIVPGSNQVLAFDIWQGQNMPFALQCLPSEVSQSFSQVTTGSMRFSLGPFHCPSDFATATTSVVDSISTSILCCPSQYQLSQSGSNTQCISTLTAGSIVPKSLYAPNGTWISWADTTISQLGTTILGNAVNGYVFASTTSSEASSTAATTIPTQTQSAISLHPTQTPAKAYNSNLSTPAKAAIAIGCLVAIIALILLFVYCSPKYRRKQNDMPLGVYEKEGSDPNSGLMGGSEDGPGGVAKHGGRESANHPVAAYQNALPPFAGGYEAGGSHPKGDSMYNNNSGPHEMDGHGQRRVT
ncbi:hypothetical protein EG329_013795 [Mollisiaceae sp. DMI_Dod_QoI]|nr:hypothetical protein EG329_013795 [Helotiales sp. DMI_Dod_QoI]